jgi:hypothetical protein
MLEKCTACGADARQDDHMLMVVCTGCRRHTPSMQGTRGDFQSEWWAARDYWNAATRQEREAATQQDAAG